MEFHVNGFLMLWVLTPFCCCFLTDNTQSSHHDSTGDLLAILVEEKDLRHQLAEAVTQIKSEFDVLKSNFTNNTQSSHHDSTGDLLAILVEEKDLRHQLAEAVTQIKSEFDVLKSNFTSLKNENAVLKQKLESIENERQHQQQHNDSNQVLFSVYLNTGDVLSGQPIVFDDILRNIGGGYENGTFHCPVEGEYMFSVTLVSNKQDLMYDIYRNTGIIAHLYTSHNGVNDYESGTVTFFTHVKVGDRIWVKSPSAITYFFSYFSGLLITR